MSSPPEEAPAFLVGAPRSGTGILQNLLRVHPDLTTLTPATNAAVGFASERSWMPLELALALARPLDAVGPHLPWRPRWLEGPMDGTFQAPGLPPAVEGSRVWSMGVPGQDPAAPADAADVTPELRAHYQHVVKALLDRDGARRFLSKDPPNSLRVPWLDAIFPRARFVHLVRDGRDVTRSISERFDAVGPGTWWGPKPAGWRTHVDDDPLAKGAWMWRASVEAVLEAAADLPSDQVLTVRYEDLTEAPRSTLAEVVGFLDLPAAPMMERLEGRLDALENRNGKWRNELSDAEVRRVMDTIGATMAKAGYDVDA